jgi:signal transduction histidine kinase
MDALRKRLMPPILLVTITVTIFVLTAAVLSTVHMNAYGDLGGDRVRPTLLLELGILLAAFGILFALLLATVRIANSRLIENYRQERRLSHAVRRAEEADQAKSVFLADISHELRTPLNSIIGFSEIMRDETFGPMDNSQYKSYAEDIHQSGRHLLALISDLFDLSRIQTGETELDEQPLDLAECLHTTARMLSCQPEPAALNFEFDLPPNRRRSWPTTAPCGTLCKTCWPTPSSTAWRAPSPSGPNRHRKAA